MEDIKVDGDWQLTRAASGDAPVAADTEEFLQRIRLESMTQEGDLFYDPDYGWSLLDFVHAEDSPLIRMAIQERVRSRMARYLEVDASTLQVAVSFAEDAIQIGITFKQADSDSQYNITITLDRIRMEVITA